MNRIKTLIAAMPMLLCIASCTTDANNGQYECVDAVKVDGKPNCSYTVVEITVNGEAHQYVKYENGNQFSLTHWKGCKYCKEQDDEECEDYDGATDNTKTIPYDSGRSEEKDRRVKGE